jgi:L-aspartate oxidase
MNEKVDVVIVGTGVSGLYCALNLPETLRITVISKDAFSRGLMTTTAFSRIH